MQHDVSALIGQRVSELRREWGWSQPKVAERIGDLTGKRIDPTAITRIETGKRPVSAAELVAFGQLFGVSLESLALLDDDEGTAADGKVAALDLLSLMETSAARLRRILSDYEDADE